MSEHDTNEYDEETLVETTDRGVKITTKIKRRSDVGDSDEHKIEACGHTAEEAIESHVDSLDYLEEHALDRVRDFNPRRGGSGE